MLCLAPNEIASAAGLAPRGGWAQKAAPDDELTVVFYLKAEEAWFKINLGEPLLFPLARRDPATIGGYRV